jgi:chorismate mutase/prephenate dehydrogenase
LNDRASLRAAPQGLDMAEELNALRDKIDAVDKQLIDLLAARLALVGEVGEVKSRHGLPIYAPDREASMLARRRAEAEALGVPGTLSRMCCAG